jgi:hypothetical protein
MIAPQYAEYHDDWNPKIIMAITTRERRKVFTRTFEVGISQAFIYSKKRIFWLPYWFTIINTMWKDIVDFEGRYEISDSGEVRNSKTLKLLTLKHDRDGYQQIGLRKTGDRKKYWFSIHRLVAKHFLESYSDDLCIDHIDHNKCNNIVSNLRAITVGDNNRNRELKPWSTNKTTGELYITGYKNGYMIRINRVDYKKCIWERDLETAIKRRDECLADIR